MSVRSNSIIMRVSIIASLAGLLFGLDVAYVNGSLHLIRSFFNVSVEDSGAVAGYLLFGAAVGAFTSGWLSREFGRKKVLITSGILFASAIAWGVTTSNFTTFLYARFVIGLGVGIASFVTPLYLSEIAPYSVRGKIIGLYQLMITIGILGVFLSNTVLSYTKSWQLMMLVLMLPALIMLIGVISLPESPRWMVLVGKEDDAKLVLQKIRNNQEEVDFELEEIKAVTKNHGSEWAMLKHGYFVKVVVLGIFLQALQQFSGINVFMYYSGHIFAGAGFTNPGIATVAIGVVNVLSTIISLRYLDKLGRKPILYAGLVLIVISCIVVGFLLQREIAGVSLSDREQNMILIASLVFIFGFAVSLGPIIWIICAEIFPLEGRDLGITFTTMANWIFNTIIGSYSLTWFDKIGVGNTFYVFAVCGFFGLFLVKFFTPETKDVPLEELELNLKNNVRLIDIGKRITKL